MFWKKGLLYVMSERISPKTPTRRRTPPPLPQQLDLCTFAWPGFRPAFLSLGAGRGTRLGPSIWLWVHHRSVSASGQDQCNLGAASERFAESSPVGWTRLHLHCGYYAAFQTPEVRLSLSECSCVHLRSVAPPSPPPGCH